MHNFFAKAFTVEDNPIANGFIVKDGSASRSATIAGAAEGNGVAKTTDAGDAVPVNDHVDKVLLGITKIRLGASLSEGDDVASNASGEAVAMTLATGTKEKRIAYLIEDGVSGDLVDCFVTNDFITTPA